MGLFMPAPRSVGGSNKIDLHGVHDTLKFHGMDQHTIARVEDAFEKHGDRGVKEVMNHLRNEQPAEHTIADHHLDAIDDAFRKHTAL